MKRNWRSALFETGVLFLLLLTPQIYSLLLAPDFFPMNLLLFKVLGVLAFSIGICFCYILAFSPPFLVVLFFVLGVTYAHLLTTTPAILQNYFPRAVLNLLPWAYPWLEKILVALGVLFLHYLALGRKGPKFLVHFALAVFLLGINDPLFMSGFHQTSIAADSRDEKRPPNILFIGTHALRFDELKKLSKDDRFPALKKFLQESPVQGEIVSPLAKPFPSLLSLLSGKNPIEHGVRQPFLKDPAILGQSLSDGPLGRMKAAGYNISIRVSDSDQTVIPPERIWNEIHRSELSPQDRQWPFMLNDRFLFGWFNNALGRFVLPEIFENSAFTEIWLPQTFAKSMREDIIQSAQSKEPQIQFFHSMRLRAPTPVQFPSMGELTTAPFLSSGEGVATNQALYRRASEQNAEFILEPTLQFLYDSKIIDQTVVVLFSDHGESFFDLDLLPASKFPRHGSELIFGADGEYGSLAMRFPSSVSKESAGLPSVANLSDVLPLTEWVLSGKSIKDFPFRAAISETEGTKMTPPMGTDLENVLSKQRSSYDSEGFRLTLVPNVFGYQLVLQKRGDARGNLIFAEAQKARDLWEKLQRDFRNDFTSGWLPALKWTSSTQEDGFLRWEKSWETNIEECRVPAPSCRWLIFFRAYHELNQNYDLSATISILDFLRKAEGVSPELKAGAEIFLFRVDAASSSLPDSMRRDLLKKTEGPGSRFRRLTDEWTSSRLVFLMAAGETESWRNLLASSLRQNAGMFRDFTNLKQGLTRLISPDRDPYQLSRKINRWPATPLSESSSALEKIIFHLKELRDGSETSLNDLFKILDSGKHHLAKGVNDAIYLYLWADFRSYSRFRDSLLQRMMGDSTVGAETLMLMETDEVIFHTKKNLLDSRFKIAGEVMKEDRTVLEKKNLILSFYKSILDRQQGLPSSLDRARWRIDDLKSASLRKLTERLQ